MFLINKRRIVMALVRCARHGKPRGRTYRYTRSVKPVGWPDTAAICGGSGCTRAGLIWLTDRESGAYDQGKRVFEFNNASMKVRAA
jgi:hypothetical protein